MKEQVELKITPKIIGKENPVAILTLDGYVDSTTAHLLKQKLATVSSETHRFIINFGGVEYVSSAGWGVVLAKIRDNREKGGDIIFVKMIKEVYSIYELLELNRVIMYFPTLEEGLKHYGKVMPAVTVTQQKAPVRKEQPQGVPKKISVETAIYTIVRDNPLFKSSQIKKALRQPQYGFTNLSTLKVYFTLRRMGLNTREKRLYYAWIQEKKRKKS